MSWVRPCGIVLSLVLIVGGSGSAKAAISHTTFLDAYDASPTQIRVRLYNNDHSNTAFLNRVTYGNASSLGGGEFRVQVSVDGGASYDAVTTTA